MKQRENDILKFSTVSLCVPDLFDTSEKQYETTPKIVVSFFFVCAALLFGYIDEKAIVTIQLASVVL